MIEEVEEPSDPQEDLKSHHEQLELLQNRGQLSGSTLIADYYKPVKLDGCTYRTHAIFVDVMEQVSGYIVVGTFMPTIVF